jgi:hypothetical protein
MFALPTRRRSRSLVVGLSSVHTDTGRRTAGARPSAMNNLHGRPRDIGYEDPSTERPGRMPRLPHRSPAGQCATPARVRPGVSTEPIEDSTARLIARASAVSTGSPVLIGCWPGPASWTPGPYRRSASGPGCWPGSRPDGGLPAAFRSRTLCMSWPAISLCTLAARGRTAPRASLSPAGGSSTPGG